MTTTPAANGSAIPTHPVLDQLHRQNRTDVTTLKGYVGHSPLDGYVRLYADLDDLTQSVDIARSDIVSFVSAPEAVLPLGGVILWINKDAQISANQAQTTRVQLNAKALTDGAEINSGRLKIFVRGGLRSSVCQSVCKVCQSVCKPCQSVCHAHTAFDRQGRAFPLKTQNFNQR